MAITLAVVDLVADYIHAHPGCRLGDVAADAGVEPAVAWDAIHAAYMAGWVRQPEYPGKGPWRFYPDGRR